MTLKSFRSRTLVGAVLGLGLLGVFVFLSGANDADSTPNVKSGTLVLDNFQIDTPIPLSGEWESFDGTLILPSTPAASFALLPQAWESRRCGCATYRMMITGLDPSIEYALKVPYQLTAYTLFLNREKLVSNGVVSAFPSIGKPEFQPQIETFTVPGETAELVFQVSNHVSRRGGPFQALLFGSSAGIQKHDFWSIFIDGTFIALFLTSSLYQFSFFATRKHKEHLYLGMLFLGVSCVLLFNTPDVIIMALVPDMNWYHLEKISSLFLYQLPLWGVLYVNSHFRTISRKRLFVVLSPIVVVYGAVLLLPVDTHSVLHPYFHLYSGILYLIAGYVLIKNLKIGGKGAIIMLGAYCIFLASVVSNTLLAPAPLPTGNYLPLSFLKLIGNHGWNPISFGLIDIVSFSLMYGFLIISIVSFSFAYSAEIEEHSRPSIPLDDSQVRLRIEAVGFSPREQEVLDLLIKGKSNKEIAAALFLSLSTVKTYISRIFKKTNARSRAEVFSFLFKSSSID